MINELKQAADYAMATIVAHLGDSHHITRFHVPAIEAYIKHLESFTPDAYAADGTPVEPDASQPVDFDMMTRDQLRDHAAANGIDLGDATKKADIVAAIQQATTTDAPSEVTE